MEQSHPSLKRVKLDKYCLWDLGCYRMVIGFRSQPFQLGILNGTSCLPVYPPDFPILCGEAQVSPVQSLSSPPLFFLLCVHETPSFIIAQMNSPIS